MSNQQDGDAAAKAGSDRSKPRLSSEGKSGEQEQAQSDEGNSNNQPSSRKDEEQQSGQPEACVLPTVSLCIHLLS